MSVPILLVDDNEADRYLISRSITESTIACQIYPFEAGDDFLEVFCDPKRYQSLVNHNTESALILLDIKMPRLDGFEVLEHLTKHRVLHTDFIIAIITSSNNERDREKAYSYSLVKEFIVKPFDSSSIEKIMTDHYPRHSS